MDNSYLEIKVIPDGTGMKVLVDADATEEDLIIAMACILKSLSLNENTAKMFKTALNVLS